MSDTFYPVFLSRKIRYAFFSDKLNKYFVLANFFADKIVVANSKMATAVVLNNIFVKYGTTRALSGATLRVEEGLIYALCGPSGCGKTTLCTTLLGMTQISHGEVGLFPHSAAPVKIPGRDVGMLCAITSKLSSI